MTILRLFACMGVVSLAVAFLPGAGLADAPATIFTTLLVQVENPPPNHEVVVSADKTKKPTSQMILSADLASIPSGAILQVCGLRLVTASGLPDADDNGLALQLVDGTENPESTKSVGARTVDPGTDPKSAIVMQTKGICASLEKGVARLAAARATLKPQLIAFEGQLNIFRDQLKIAQSMNNQQLIATWRAQVAAAQTQVDVLRAAMSPPAKFRLRTTTGNGRISLYGRPPVEESSFAPRLLLTYELPESWPPAAGWSQPRGDAQHSGRSAWRMYNPNGAYTPGSFKVRSLGGTAFAEVSPPVLLYGRQVLAVLADGSAIQMMNGDGGVVKSLPLPVVPKFMGVSQHGWVYVTGENKLVVQGIETGRRITIETTEETVLAPPTIGADGSLYVVTNEYVSAYPPPPVAEYVPLWRYRTGATVNNDVSAVALGEDGRTAYVVDKPSTSMIALDTATGAVKWKQQGVEISKGANEPMPVPVVAGKTVFVTNQVPIGTALYMVEDDTEIPTLETTPGAGVTAPAVGPDKSVYYFRDGVLRRYRSDLRETAVGGPGCGEMAGFDLLRADQSGNLYVLDRNKKRFAFISAGERSVPAGACAPVNLEVGSSLAIAADGTAFGYDEKRRIHAIVPAAAAFATGNALTLSNEILKLSPDAKTVVENNDMTFRAGKTIGTAGGLTLPANTNINLVAGERIAFNPGLRVVQGARLRARTGF